MHYHHQFGVLVPFVKKHFKIIVLALAGIFILSQLVVLLARTDAADTGFQVPTSTHTPNSWDVNTVTNLQTPGDGLTVNDNDNGEQGYDEFDFNIPDGSNIDGIEILADARSSDFFGCKLGIALSWNDGDDYTSYKLQNIEGDAQSNFFTETFGGATDTWGRTWDDNDFSNDDFVVKLADVDDSASCHSDPNPPRTYVDFLRVKVYFSDPTGSIKIKKNVKDGTSSQGFSFTTDAPGGNFTLYDDNDNQTPSSKTFNDVPLNTTYTFTEDPVTGWELDDIDCTNGASVEINGSAVSITPTANKKNVECEFENKKLPTGDIKAKKFNDLDGDGNKDDNESYLTGWVFRLYNANWVEAGEQSTGQDFWAKFDDQPIGQYFVCEVQQEGWGQTNPVDPDGVANQSGATDEASRCLSVGLTKDEREELKFGNAELPKLSLNKQVVGGQAVSTDWTLSATPNPGTVVQGAGGFSGAYVSANTTYTLGESTGPANYQASEWACVVETGPFSQPTGNASVNLGYGAEVACTITNTFVPPNATVIAHKIVCDDEADLPNWGPGGPNIGASSASQWLTDNANNGCSLVENWDYQYRLSGSSSPEPTGYGELPGWTTFTDSTDITLSGNTTIQLREVLPNGYIPFTGQHSQDNVSAEFYCHTDVANYDNWEWIQGPQGGTTYYCVAWNVQKNFNVHAAKVICDTEEYLPNWGNGVSNGAPASIGATTAQDFIDDSEGHCELAAGWGFQWSADNVGNPGDNLGDGGNGWTTFSGSVSLHPSDTGSGNRVWFREIADPDFVPFSGQNTTQDYSAELYCNDDILNYDNWEWIANPQPEADYYCVGFNVLKQATLNATKIVCDSEDSLPDYGDGGPDIDANTAADFLSQNPNCHEVAWDFQWVANDQSSSNPGDETPIAPSLPWQTFNGGSVNIPLAELGQTNKIWVREVFDPAYIEFAGQTTVDTFGSAEIYCHNDILNYDNWEWIENLQDNTDYYCVAWNVLKPAVLSAVKIECVSEIYLPNWGDGSHGPMTATTADEFLTAVNPAEGDPVCQKVDWEFEWNTADAGDPDDNTGHIDSWNTFSDTANIWTAALEGDDIRVREIWQDGYVPFTGQNTDQNVSAEIYCGDDVLHYDNWEWLDNIVSGQTYYCVAWNVWSDGLISGLLYNDLNEDGDKDIDEPELQNMNVYLLTHNSPWFLRATTTTSSTPGTLGQYLFENLSAGEYWVCQDLQPGWIQTQLNSAGLGGIDIGSATPGTQIGGDPDPVLDDLIAQFCYPVTLTRLNPNSTDNDFGSFFDEEGFVGGVSDVNEDGEVLAETGSPAILALVVGFMLIGSAILVRSTKKQ